jgi:hypothetical protein
VLIQDLNDLSSANHVILLFKDNDNAFVEEIVIKNAGNGLSCFLKEIKHIINEGKGFLDLVMLKSFSFFEKDDHKNIDEFLIVKHRYDKSLKGFWEL